MNPACIHTYLFGCLEPVASGDHQLDALCRMTHQLLPPGGDILSDRADDLAAVVMMVYHVLCLFRQLQCG